MLVFSSLAWAIGSLYSRHASLPRRPLVGVAMQMLTAGVMLAVISAASGESVDPGAVSIESWLGLAYLIVAGSLVAFTAYMWLLRNTATSLVGTYAYVNPVVAVLLGTLDPRRAARLEDDRRRRDHPRRGRADRAGAQARAGAHGRAPAGCCRRTRPLTSTA